MSCSSRVVKDKVNFIMEVTERTPQDAFGGLLIKEEVRGVLCVVCFFFFYALRH
jgi:UDP-N-acetylglucosamine pyrophosphorylase